MGHISHEYRRSSIGTAIEKAGKSLVHMHVSDSNRRILGDGHIDFNEVFSSLRKIKYDAYLTLEAILTSDARKEMIRARKRLHHLIIGA